MYLFILNTDIETVNNGDAEPVEDYTPLAPSRVSFESWEQKKDIDISIVNDGIQERTESFQLRLVNPHGGRLGDISVAEIVIEDDDYDDRKLYICSKDFYKR